MSELNDAHRSPLVTGDKTLGDVTRDICAPMDARPSGLWWAAFFVSFVALLVGAAAVWYQIATGIGTWGLNKTIGWGFDGLTSSVRQGLTMGTSGVSDHATAWVTS